MLKKINVLFMGTNDFAQEVLSTLLTISELTVVGVVCQPDKKLTRKQKIIFCPVKELALAKKIKLFQPEKIIEAFYDLHNLAIDVIITCAYGQFLPSKVLALPKILALNVHASLLPKLRGGAPIHWAIINNFSETGISLMKMSLKMDQGDIFIQEKTIIANDETYYSLKIKLIILAKQMLVNYLVNIINGEIKSKKQDESAVTFGFNITRQNELINWDQPAILVSCQVRGLYNNPISYTTLNDFIYKIHQVVVSDQVSKVLPGTITLINKLGIYVASKDYDVVIKQIQPAAKKVINASNYFGSLDYPLKVKMVFK